eukprot:TRINITY_DN2715_c0_g1_i5.p1 TRINITY_DN2715_c0_g1~~TRINITY_DN2715_c0_g1_i5.p1  ORF type:complete len:171 (-),score=26.60 TRINITY_DN2715_c0_g1_i5:186-698(-)
MIRRPPRSTLSSSSAASDVYKRQVSTQSTGTHTLDMPGHPHSPFGHGGFDEAYPVGASPLRYNQHFPGGHRHELARHRSTRLDSSPVTTVAGGYPGNRYLCGTHVEVHPPQHHEFVDAGTARSMMRYGYGHPYNPGHHLSVRPYSHNLANRGDIFGPHHKSEPRPRHFLR